MRSLSRLSPILTILFVLLAHNKTKAQVSFSNMTSVLTNSSGTSGVALGVVDMNDDGLDDIIRLDKGKDLYVEFQKQDGSAFETLSFGQITGLNQWSMCIGDMDNNGTNEILSGGYYNGLTLVNFGMNGDMSMIEVLPESVNIFVQGSNFVDINNDGYLDVFACNDDGAPSIWENDRYGRFNVNTDWIDLSINGSLEENASGNYGSIWSDIDNDGDLDLYIAKCRQGITDVTDDRRVNKLYINDGHGNYSEDSEGRGLNIGWQSWSADFQDINNDGHLDVFITNHDHPSQVLMNDGDGNFTELEGIGIEVLGLPVQGVMRDFDNDGWVDLLVSGSSSQLFLNNRDMSFTEVTDAFDMSGLQSFALGDLNNDGYLDIFGGYATGYNSPSNVLDKVWINDGGDNNYLSINLEGEISNKNAIGARIEIYGIWGVQIREVRSGESYGIMNATTQYFGLGQAETIDSVIVRWPSGFVSKETNVTVNSKVRLLEGGCLMQPPTIMMEGSTVFCTGDRIVLSVPKEYFAYTWSNGDTTSSTIIYESGFYSLAVENEEGCKAFSETINIEVDPQFSPEITSQGAEIFCEGEDVILTLTQLEEVYPIIWSTGEQSQSIVANESGIYSVQVEGLCGSFISNSIEVTVLDYRDAPIAQGDTIMEGETAKLTAEGDNLAWYTNETDENYIAQGNVIEILGLISNASFFVAHLAGENDINAKVGMEDHSGSEYSVIENNNNLLIFDAVNNFTLDSVKVYTDAPGVRKVLLLDADENEIGSALIDVPAGENHVYLGIDIPAGENMSLTTDADVNEQNIGTTGPRLQRNNENVDYPYLVEDIVTIKDSNFGGSYYYYFYDWRISYDSDECPSARTKVDVVLENPNSLVGLVENEDVVIFPNPSSGYINIDLESHHLLPIAVSVVDVNGRLVNETVISDNQNRLDLSNFTNGLYLLELKSENSRLYKKVLIAK